MSSAGVNQGQGACGGVEEAEDEESSSSSSISTIVEEDELETFRKNWKKDLALGAKNTPISPTKKQKKREEDIPESIEDEARGYFLEGVEHEENGELFEAIQKYRKAINLVPDIEFKAFEHNRRRRAQQQVKEVENKGNDNSDEEVEEIPEDTSNDEDIDLLIKFSRMRLKGNQGSGLCEPETVSNANGHICKLPMEVLIHILKWVVSSELDLRSLENFAEVCRGFFVAARSSDIWRRVCIQTWGLAALPNEELGLGGWRSLFISRPRVNFNGCYISRVTYLREGERAFQDNEFYKSWHVVHYYRLLRFFPGGRVIMVTTAEEPSVSVKMMNNRYSCAIQGCMFGHFRTKGNNILCVLQKAKPPPTSNRRFSLRQKRQNKNPSYLFEVPDQDFHMELEIQGKRNHQLQWLCYNVISKYKNGREQVSDIDVSNLNNYPVMRFSRVKSYTLETVQPLI